MNLRLKELRINHDMTQIQIAEYLKMTKQGYSHYETGIREPDVKTLCKHADLYKVSVDYILERESPDTIIITNKDAERVYTAYISANDNVREAIDKLLGLDK